jgi:dienelactone hydrolase
MNPFAVRQSVETIRVKFAAGASAVDIHCPDITALAPLVIVAHGFPRRRRNMSGWGRHLAMEGFVAAVPDLPAWSDHARNGRFISELNEYLCTAESSRWHIDPAQVGLVGFSAGGLASLLSAAGNPGLAIWVGLDPVDLNGLGVKAAPFLNCPALVLTAEPSACNAHGNARSIIAALRRCEHIQVTGARHVDAEWPTDWLAEAVCGRATDEKRSEFLLHATAALHEALAVKKL